MKKLLPLLLCTLSLSGISQAQTDSKTLLEKTSFEGLKFRSIGPALTSGRIADLAVNPKNHNEYYVATASGGVWKTTNHGITFQPLFDGEGSYSIGCITMDPSNENIIWVGTGENNNQRSVNYGDGIYKSMDGGKSWTNMGLQNSQHIGMIAVDPENSNIVYVAAYGPLWNAGGDRGIYKSTNGGKDWERILFVSENTGFNEIHIDPHNPKVLYATAHQRRRHVWTYVSGGPESAIYKSNDGGKTWEKIENGIPSGDKGRISLALSPADPDVIYAMIEGHGTYRSDDRGGSFNFVNDYNTSGNYYVELVPHPTDVNVVYSMDTYLHVSRDGGRSWERVPEENKHVDNHCLWINPNDPDQMIDGCDGGLYETFDGAENWQFKPNLPVTQFYRVAVDHSRPFYHVTGGTQDNFSLGGPSRTINSRGIANSDWYVTSTGDGFESQVDPIDPNIVYAQAQYGYLSRYDRKSGESVGIRPSPGKDEKAFRWNWDAPLLISPHDHKTLYFAANKVFKSTDMGSSWKEISGDLTQQIDRHSLPVMGKIQSVDAIAYDQSTSQYGNIVALDESPLKAGLLYVGTDDGLIQVTDDDGENWKRLENFPGVPKNTYVNALVASPLEENTVFAVFNNHKNGDFKPYILKSTNRGASWENISGNLPERGSVYSIRQDFKNKDLLFAGTEFGLFFSVDGGKKWQQLKTGLPTIAIRDIDIQKEENDLVLATFGRGFYILDDYSPLREVNNELLKKDKYFFPIPTALSFLEAQPLGYGKIGFQGASYFHADNPAMGATFTYYLKDTPKSLKEKRQEKEKEAIKDSKPIQYPPKEALRAEDREEENYLIFVIKDRKGKEVSRKTAKPEAGIQRINWEGTYSSIAETSDEDAPLTEGEQAHLALPGKYSVSVFISKDGQISQLFPAQEFELKWLNNNTLEAGDKEALLAFQQKTEQLRRKINALDNYYQNLKNKIIKLKANARNTPGVEISLLDSLRILEYKLADISIPLSGDQSLSKREFETAPSLGDRLGDVYWNSYHTTAAPTGLQQNNLQIAMEEYDKLRKDILAISLKAEAINHQLQQQGAPYLEDELPD